MMREDAVVAGAGAAGLAAAAMLKKAGVQPAVLERSATVGSSWRSRYDSLRLNTIRWDSALPGYRMHRRYGRWPSRDDWIAYLERYTEHHRLDIRFRTEVQRVDRAAGGWRVETSSGTLDTDAVVIATGFDHDPHVPEWPGRETFPGELLHAASYRSPEPFRGKDVLIVAPGNTGSEIAFELLRNGATRVRASMRTPPNIINREQFGLPLLQMLAIASNRMPVPYLDFNARLIQRMMFGDLSKYGIPPSPRGLASNIRDRGTSPLVDDGFIDAVKRGEIETLPVIDRFEGPEVVLADGARIRPDVVIACTGYERGLDPVVGHLGVLRADGRPAVLEGKRIRHSPGLYFIGYTPRLAGGLRQFKYEARRIARSVRRRRSGLAEAG